VPDSTKYIVGWPATAGSRRGVDFDGVVGLLVAAVVL
jgi:hypothetical protein